MRTGILARRDDLLVRRLVLAPGEAMPWHRDVCQRFGVVVRGERLRIELRDGGEALELDVHPGLAEWDAPDDRVHRAVNVGRVDYEEVVLFLLETPGADPQPGPGAA